jgi:hypothetical protein
MKAAIFLPGCCSTEKVLAIRDAVDQGRITGMDKDVRFVGGYGFGLCGRVNAYPGPYSSIDHYDVLAQKGDYDGKHVSFFLGKSRQTGKWEVFCVMVQQDSGWLLIPVQPARKEAERANWESGTIFSAQH